MNLFLRQTFISISIIMLIFSCSKENIEVTPDHETIKIIKDPKELTQQQARNNLLNATRKNNKEELSAVIDNIIDTHNPNFAWNRFWDNLSNDMTPDQFKILFEYQVNFTGIARASYKRRGDPEIIHSYIKFLTNSLEKAMDSTLFRDNKKYKDNYINTFLNVANEINNIIKDINGYSLIEDVARNIYNIYYSINYHYKIETLTDTRRSRIKRLFLSFHKDLNGKTYAINAFQDKQNRYWLNLVRRFTSIKKVEAKINEAMFIPKMLMPNEIDNTYRFIIKNLLEFQRSKKRNKSTKTTKTFIGYLLKNYCLHQALYLDKVKKIDKESETLTLQFKCTKITNKYITNFKEYNNSLTSDPSGSNNDP